MVITRSKEEVFGYIREKIKTRLCNWKGKLLSPAGKEVLLMSVIIALPTYFKSCFRLSIRLCSDISSLMSKFWWGMNKEKHRAHWLRRKKLSNINAEEGGVLGFRGLENYNKALLAK